jgi:hypothetical protein
MGYKKLIHIGLLFFVCHSCKGDPREKDIDTQIKSIGLSQFFKNGDKPLDIYDLSNFGKVVIDIPEPQSSSYGILVVNGYELGEKYGSKKPAVTLKNMDLNSEFFSTSHSAFRSFSVKDGILKLELINNVDDKIKVILYRCKE